MAGDGVGFGFAVVLLGSVSSNPCEASWSEQNQHQQTKFKPTHLELRGLLSSELAIPFEGNHGMEVMEWMPFESAQRTLLSPSPTATCLIASHGHVPSDMGLPKTNS